MQSQLFKISLLFVLFLQLSCQIDGSSDRGVRMSEEEVTKEQLWPDGIITRYNPYGLTNAEDCPRVPGTFFVGDTAACTTYFPAMGEHTIIEGNPSYRYSLRIDGIKGKMSFKLDNSFSEKCASNPKIQFLQRSFKGSYLVTVASGRALVVQSDKSKKEKLVCKVVLLPADKTTPI